ncbi:hypothetical protein EVAR_63729_1 [Eumeta japonica]|uniref:Uncharacterized protein n=1 Tax=Eumeta variegata TaxID=151549 RepID=A0A4C1ZHY5_EUMVA|nr:hypothetical protein EVAR_63729_1 [Eumeta japonica]
MREQKSPLKELLTNKKNNQRPITAAVVTVRQWIGVPSVVDSRQRPAAHASEWRSGIGRQLTRTIKSCASASPNITANTSGTSRRGRARRPRGPTQAVLRACVLPKTRAVRRAAPRTGLGIICDYPQFNETPDIHPTAPKLRSPHFKLLKCRRLGTAANTNMHSTGTAAPGAYRTHEVSDAARLPRCRRRGACPDIVGTITLIVNQCFGGPLVDRKDYPDEGRSEKKKTLAR